MCVCTWVWYSTCVCMHVCECVRAFMCVWCSTCVYVCVKVHTCLCLCACACVCGAVCVCMFVHRSKPDLECLSLSFPYLVSGNYLFGLCAHIHTCAIYTQRSEDLLFLACVSSGIELKSSGGLAVSPTTTGQSCLPSTLLWSSPF